MATLSSFFLAMALYPEVQIAAQAEIDSVLTNGRLPQLSDCSSLPYIECVMREVLRWNPIGPLGARCTRSPITFAKTPYIGLPHLLTKDDVYRGHDLPAGSIVLANVWWVMELLNSRRRSSGGLNPGPFCGIPLCFQPLKNFNPSAL